MSAPYGKRKSWKDAKRHIQKTHREFWRLIARRIEELKLDDIDLQRFNGLRGTAPMTGALRLSDMVAHHRFALDVAREVRDFSKVSPDLEFYHLTLLADEGIMSDRKPKFALRLLKRRADKAMRKMGLDGIYVVETQPLMNWPQKGKGRTLLAHIHVLGWKPRNSSGDSVRELHRALGYDKGRSNIAWSCQFGADPIKVRVITPDRGCPSYWAAYLLKLPHEAKNLVRARTDEVTSRAVPEFRFRSTTSGYRPELAMRLFELLAQLPVCATIGGVGAGAAILNRCRNRLATWDGERRAKWEKRGLDPVPVFNERDFWKRTHKNRRVRYRPFFIDGPTIEQRAIRPRT